MTSAPHLDEELVHRLPLPLAQLYRRSHNAKTALERHQAAYYLWEAALKLLGSVAIIEYAELGDHDRQLAERLQNLARPSLGHWWEFVRRLVPVLAATGDPHFATTRELVLGKTRDDLPRAAGLDAALCEALENRGGARSTVRLSELFDRLVQYRNREMGHGAAGQHAGDFYERMGRALLAGIGELLWKLDVLAGRRLLYVAEVRGQASGSWLIERYELMGEASRRIESVEIPMSEVARLPRAKGLYLSSAQGGSRAMGMDPGIATGSFSLRLLRPLLLFDDDSNEVFFLNGRKGRRRAEYLCYTTGRVDDRAELGTEQRDLLARVLGGTVDDDAVGTWAARSQDEEPAVPTGAADPPRRSLGEFELLSRIGRGGMGMVYRAWQPSLGRQVALKLLLRSGDPKAEARFAREIHSLGRVEHPNVVKIFTSGSEGDQWFYAMELVEGADLGTVCGHLTGSTASEVGPSEWHQALSTACREAKTKEQILSDTHLTKAPALPVAAPEGSPISHVAPPPGAQAVARTGHGHVTQVVELIRQVACAAHALHEARVIHRDIKPGNIMISPDGGHAILMDLGLAQLADETEGRLTRTRQFVGTLRYASPEQVLAAAPLDRRSDVYSLGATLWELLTLRPLFGATDATPTADLMMQILQTDPERAQRLNPRVPADLQAIVMKCLDKDRTRRYATAAELAEDLARWQQGEPVRAQPPSLRYMLGKYVRRHRLPLAAVAAMVVALVAGLIALGTGVAVLHVSAARDDAEKARDSATQAQQEAEAARESEAEARRGEEAAHKRAQEFAAIARDRAVRLSVKTGVQLMNDGDLPGALVWFGDAMTMDKADSAEAERHRMRLGAGMAECPRLARVWFHEGKITQCDLSRDGRRLATAGSDGLVMVWKLSADKELCKFTHPGITHVGFSPDGSRLVTTGEDKTARVWDAATGEPVGDPLVHRSKVHHAAFSPDGDRLVTATEGKNARVWDVKTGKVLLTFRHTAERPPLSGMDKTPAEGDTAKGPSADEIPAHEGAVLHAEYSPDGSLVVTAGADRVARVWNAKNGQLVHVLKHADEVHLASFSSDGRWIATASHVPSDRKDWKESRDSKKGTLQVWDAKTGMSLQVWDAKTGLDVPESFEHRDKINHFMFSSDGKKILTASEDHTAQVWDLGQPRKPKRPESKSPFDPDDPAGARAREEGRRYLLDDRPVYHAKGVNHVSFSPDGRYFVTASSDGTARVWDAALGTSATPPLNHGGRVIHSSFSSDGRWVLTASEDQKIRLWDLHRPIVSDPMPKEARRVRSVAFSPDGGTMVLVNEDGTVWLSKTNSGERISLPLEAGTGVTEAWFSPDGRRLATVTDAGALQVWKSDTAQPITDAVICAGEISDAVFSNDGRLLVVISSGQMKLYDADTGAPGVELKQKDTVYRAVFSPDGKVLASIMGTDQTLRFWDVKSGEEAFPLEQRRVFAAWDVAFSRDGRLLVTADGDDKATAIVWNMATGLPIAILKHRTFVTRVRFSRDGRQVLTSDGDNGAWVWEIAGVGAEADPAASSPVTLEEPKAGPFYHIEFAWQAAFSPNGRYVVTAVEDHAVQVWDVVTGEPVTPPLRHPGMLSYAAFSDDNKSVVTIGDGRIARVWSLTPDPRLKPECLLDLIQLQNGNQISSENGRLVRLDPAAFRQKWQKQSATDLGNPVPAVEKDLNWHWRQAADCEAAGKWSAVVWHLDQIPRSQRTSLLWARLGDAHRNLGDYAAALADYDEADKCVPRVERLPWDIACVARECGEHCLDAVMARDKPFNLEDAKQVKNHFQECKERLDELEKLHPGHCLTRAGYNDLVESYLRLGGSCIDAGEGAEARNTLERCQELVKKLPAGSAPARKRQSDLVNAYIRLGEMYAKTKDFDAARDAYRLCQKLLKAMPESDPEVVNSRRVLAASFSDLGDALSKATDQKKEAREWYREALSLRMALDAEKEELFALYKKLGDISRDLQDAAAEDYFLQAVETARAWARNDPDSDTARRNVDVTYDTLAEFRLERGDLKGAEGYYRKSLEWDEQWRADQPQNRSAVEMLRYTYKNLGTICLRQGDKAGAQRNYEKSIQAAQVWNEANSTNKETQKSLADAYANIGAACSEAGAPVEAIVYFREAVMRRQYLVELAPEDMKAKTDLAIAEEWLGDLYLQVGDLASAIRHGRNCVDLKRKVVESEKQSAASQSSLSMGVWWLGIVLGKAGETEKARDLFKEYIEIRDELLVDDKDNADLEQSLAYAYERVGNKYVELGYAAEGSLHLQDALKIWEKAANDKQDGSTFDKNVADLCHALAKAAGEQGDPAAAREYEDRARTILEALAKNAPDIVQWQTYLATNYGSHGNLEWQAANFDAAVDWYEKGLTILEKLDAAGKLADKKSQESLRSQRRNRAACKLAAEAMKDLEFAKKQEPKELATDLLLLRAGTMARRGDYDDALATAEELRKLGPEDPKILYEVARCYALLTRIEVKGRVKDDITEKDELARRETCLKQALAALTKAIDNNYNDGAQLLNDADLDILRQEPGYPELIKRLKPDAALTDK